MLLLLLFILHYNIYILSNIIYNIMLTDVCILNHPCIPRINLSHSV